MSELIMKDVRYQTFQQKMLERMMPYICLFQLTILFENMGAYAMRPVYPTYLFLIILIFIQYLGLTSLVSEKKNKRPGLFTIGSICIFITNQI